MKRLTRQDAADLAGVSFSTINGWVANGALRSSLPDRPLRFTEADVLTAKHLAHAGDAVPRWRDAPHRAGKRLRALREGAGLNQQQLARQADLAHEEISRLEHGDKCPQAPTVHKLSQALGVPPAQFVDDSPMGLELLTTDEAGHRLDVPGTRVRVWMQQGVLPGVKVGGEWRVPAIAVAELDRSGRLRGASRRLDPRYRG